MPDTYSDLRHRYGLGADSYEPHNNIFAGRTYLREMYQCYGYPLLFAAYNAGSKRLGDYLLRDIALPIETKNYVGTILPGASKLLFSSAMKVNYRPNFLPEVVAPAWRQLCR